MAVPRAVKGGYSSLSVDFMCKRNREIKLRYVCPLVIGQSWKNWLRFCMLHDGEHASKVVGRATRLQLCLLLLLLIAGRGMLSVNGRRRLEGKPYTI